MRRVIYSFLQQRDSGILWWLAIMCLLLFLSGTAATKKNWASDPDTGVKTSHPMINQWLTPICARWGLWPWLLMGTWSIACIQSLSYSSLVRRNIVNVYWKIFRFHIFNYILKYIKILQGTESDGTLKNVLWRKGSDSIPRVWYTSTWVQ